MQIRVGTESRWGTLPTALFALLLLAGNGCPEPGSAAFEIEPGELEFGSQPVGCPADPVAFLVRNTGEVPLNLTVSPVEGDEDSYSFSGDDVDGDHLLEVGAELEIQVTFEPLQGGSASGWVHIESAELADGGGSGTVTLSGTGSGDEDGDGLATACGDCDDTDETSYPGADEVCDGQDNDCDGVLPTDEEDGDGDGWSGCGGDCDDGDAAVFPGAEEGCDGVDTDCDGILGETEVDADGDGFFAACDGPSGGPDCDDTNPEVFPGAPDLCDDIADNDCDGATDPLED
ncbi:MAG: putative metal-binding motif-containing protein, partial [Myxococcota bacterium]|nr:putative metal-binding motif-containing protein [Myxococcota bacterium]